MCVFIICLPHGRRLLLTPGMGMRMGGDHLGQVWIQSPLPFFFFEILVCVLGGEIPPKNLNMFIYTENDIESHRNTQNINIKPKTHPKHENTFSKIQKNLKNIQQKLS